MPFVAEKVKQFRCGRCGHQIKTDDSKALTIIKCGKCGVGVEVPAMFDRYLLLARLGRGSSGMVFRARDTILNRDVALKVLHSDQGDKDLATHCLNEARTLAALNHPNVVQVYRIGEYKDQHYIVMELVTGGCAKKYLEGDEPLSERKAIELGMAVADGLNAAHQAGLVHMDVKPGNILLDEDDNPKLIDFGAAQYQSRLKEVGLVGTPYYVAPEAVRERVVDQKSDIYSLGATLFHLVTGHPPFEAETAKEVIKMRLKKPAPSALVHRDSLHERTVEVLAAMLVANPAGRLGDYETVIDHLGDALSAVDEGPMGTAEIAAAELASVQSGNDGEDLIAALSEVRSEIGGGNVSNDSPRPASAVVAQPVLMGRPKRKQSSSMLVLGPIAGAIVLIVVVLAVMIGTAGPEKQEPPDPAVAIGSPPDTSTTVDPVPDPVAPVEPEPDPVGPSVDPEPEPIVPPPVEPKPVPPVKTPDRDGPHNSWTRVESIDLDNGPKPPSLPDSPLPNTPQPPKPGLKLPSLHAIDFATLHPDSAQSEKGAKLSMNEEDGSIIASNNPGVRDVYTVYAETAIESLTALRLEALPDDSLPKSGPGWGTGGKFSIVEIEVFAKKKGDPGQPKRIGIKRATADMALPGKEIGKAIDGKKNTFWLVQGKPGEKRVATLMFEKPIGDEGGTEIVISVVNGIGLGRFRLMVTSMKDPLRK